MKVSDFVAKFLAQQGVAHVFTVSGGASLHLIHSLANTPGTTYVCSQHEQAGAMAADAYARVTGNLGAAVATSGPGATNLLTGVCCAFYDSVPVMYITGQVATFRQKGDTGVRQMGFQETDTVEIFRPVTKYCVQVSDPKRIRFELEKASYLAKAGRPGPVLIDIPDDVQRTEIEPEGLDSFHAPTSKSRPADLQSIVAQCVEMLSNANRPVIILGWGIRLAGAAEIAQSVIEKLGIPLAPTWAVADMLPSQHPLMIGTFGTHGTRHANLAVQNADLVISIGARLDTKATGSPATTFARAAKKIVVDVDVHELRKFASLGVNVDLPIHCDATNFLRELLTQVKGPLPIESWLRQVRDWKRKYPVCPDEYFEASDVHPYAFVKQLSQACVAGDQLFLDTGCTLAWMMQAFEFKQGQRVFHDWNNTAMGWALPAAIAASLATNRQPVWCVTGDGSLQMNIQELGTLARHQLPVRIIVMNNHGHSMIQQTQDQWLGSNYLASSVQGGLADPDYNTIARAFGIQTASISNASDVEKVVDIAQCVSGPILCTVEIDSKYRVSPQVKYGRPNEDPEPLLDRDEFLREMIIPPLEVSITPLSQPGRAKPAA